MSSIFRILLACSFMFSISQPTWAEESDIPAPSAIYYAIQEPFTINFLNQSQQKARYLQIRVALKSSNADSIASAEENLPMLQDALLDLFSAQTYADMLSTEGRIALQQTALDTVKSILNEETGNDEIDAIYFTSFILQ